MKHPLEVTEDDLLAFADGQLSGRRAARVARHLRAHPEDADRMREYIRQDHAIRSAYDHVLKEPVPSHLKAIVMSRAKAAPGFAPLLQQATTVALAVLVVVAGWYWMAEQSDHDPQINYAYNDFTSRVISAYQAPERTQSVSTEDSAAIIATPDLSRHGYRSQQRNWIGSGDRLLMELVYQGEHGEPLRLYVDQEVSQHSDVYFMQRDDVQIALWEQGGKRYALVGGQNISDLAMLVDAARSPPPPLPQVVRPGQAQANGDYGAAHDHPQPGQISSGGSVPNSPANQPLDKERVVPVSEPVPVNTGEM